jgi:hypothetical protein
VCYGSLSWIVWEIIARLSCDPIYFAQQSGHSTELYFQPADYVHHGIVTRATLGHTLTGTLESLMAYDKGFLERSTEQSREGVGGSREGVGGSREELEGAGGSRREQGGSWREQEGAERPQSK